MGRLCLSELYVLMNHRNWFMLIFGFETQYVYLPDINGVNLGMAKAVFPILWRLEPVADVYIGMSLREGKNRNRLYP
jgi:hypothetical protein